jgi:hypothetical protein
MAAVVVVLGSLSAAGPAAADAQSFSNATALDAGGAPSEIAVSGMSGVTSKLTVTINFADFSVTPPNNLDVLLVAPDGRGTILMSDAGGNSEQASATLVFDDGAADPVPGASIASGTFKPTDYDPPSDPDSSRSPRPAGHRTSATR